MSDEGLGKPAVDYRLSRGQRWEWVIHMATGYDEHEMVVLLRNDPEHGLESGDIGTIVGVYERHGAFDVEFTRAEGRPVAIITLTPDEIRPMGGEELLHARPISLDGQSRV